MVNDSSICNRGAAQGILMPLHLCDSVLVPSRDAGSIEGRRGGGADIL